MASEPPDPWWHRPFHYLMVVVFYLLVFLLGGGALAILPYGIRLLRGLLADESMTSLLLRGAVGGVLACGFTVWLLRRKPRP